MREVFISFAQLLDDRLLRGVHTTEDAVRYTLFHAALKIGNIEPADLLLEVPHPVIEGARVDAVINRKGDASSVALEVKYHRSIPSERNSPRTQLAGAVLADIFRLARLPQSFADRRMFVYLTDVEMAGYFRNSTNGLRFFFDAGEGIRVDPSPRQLAPLAATLRRQVETLEVDCLATSILKTELRAGHSLRVFEIQHAA